MIVKKKAEFFIEIITIKNMLIVNLKKEIFFPCLAKIPKTKLNF